MLKSALLAGAVALAMSSPVFACDTLEGVKEILKAQGASFSVVPADELEEFVDGIVPVIGGEPEGVTNAIVATMGEVVVFGLEIDGCMTPPIPFPLGV